jgi:hypothetical protein
LLNKVRKTLDLSDVIQFKNELFSITKKRWLTYSTLKHNPALLSNLSINFLPIDAAGV